MAERVRGSAGQKMRKRRMARSHGLCEMCIADGKDFPALATAVDHIKPLALGGEDVDENTRNLCDDHHAKVTADQFEHDRKLRVAVGLDGWPVDASASH